MYYRFQDIAAYWLKIATPIVFGAPVRGETYCCYGFTFGEVGRFRFGFEEKKRGFGTVRFSFYYAATVCGYGAGRGSGKIRQMMGGGWARSVGGLSR